MAASTLVTSGNSLTRLNGASKLSKPVQRRYEVTQVKFDFTRKVHETHNQALHTIHTDTNEQIKQAYAEDKALRDELADQLSEDARKALDVRIDNHLAALISSQDCTVSHLQKTQQDELIKLALLPDPMLHKRTFKDAWDSFWTMGESDLEELGLPSPTGWRSFLPGLTYGFTNYNAATKRENELLAEYQAALRAAGIGGPAEPQQEIIDVEYTEVEQ